jgi:hypothetical protein
MTVFVCDVPFNQWRMMICTNAAKDDIETFLPGASEQLELDDFFKPDGSFTARVTNVKEDVIKTVICLNIETIRQYIQVGNVVPVYESLFRSAILATQLATCALGVTTLNNELRANLVGFIVRKLLSVMWQTNECKHTLTVRDNFTSFETLLHWKEAHIALGGEGVQLFLDIAQLDDEMFKSTIVDIIEKYKNKEPFAFGSLLMTDPDVAYVLSDTTLARLTDTVTMPLGLTTVFHELCHYSDYMLDCLNESARTNAELQIGIASHMLTSLLRLFIIKPVQEKVDG